MANSQIQTGKQEGRHEDLYMLSAGRGKELMFPHVFEVWKQLGGS